jgi:formylglycine-generating enzyme required for sulfatase activity
LVEVPSVVGSNATEARDLLEAAGLVLGNRSEEESREPEGTVLRQAIPAGGRVERGTAVDLVVATRRAPSRERALTATLDQPPAWDDDDVLNRRVLIQGGTFQMGSPESDPDADPREYPEHRVTVSDFYLQEHEVTNEEYRRLVPAHDPDARDDHPVVRVSWDDAMAYAEWLGGTLPTEAQWEFAARGRDGRKYPWGDEDATCERANYAECGLPLGLAAVKSYEAGATPEGIYDLAGNVWEWCLDWYAPYESTGQTDPTGPPESSWSPPARVLRGGSFSDFPRDLRAAVRVHDIPGHRRDLYGDFGFRVAWASSGGQE